MSKIWRILTKIIIKLVKFTLGKKKEKEKYPQILCQKIAKFSQEKKNTWVQWVLGKPITKKRCATTLPLENSWEGDRLQKVGVKLECEQTLVHVSWCETSSTNFQFLILSHTFSQFSFNECQ
jgi:hypothetical protein